MLIQEAVGETRFTNNIVVLEGWAFGSPSVFCTSLTTVLLVVGLLHETARAECVDEELAEQQRLQAQAARPRAPRLRQGAAARDSASGGYFVSDLFEATYIVGGSYTYHMTEDTAVEASGWFTHTSAQIVRAVEDGRATTLRDAYAPETFFAVAPLVPAARQVLQLGGSVIHFDFHLDLGVGVVSSPTSRGVTGVGGVGFKLYANKAMAIRFDFRDSAHRQELLEEKYLVNDLSLTAGLSISCRWGFDMRVAVLITLLPSSVCGKRVGAAAAARGRAAAPCRRAAARRGHPARRAAEGIREDPREPVHRARPRRRGLVGRLQLARPGLLEHQHAALLHGLARDGAARRGRGLRGHDQRHRHRQCHALERVRGARQAPDSHIRIEAETKDDSSFTTATENTFTIDVPARREVTLRAAAEDDMGYSWGKKKTKGSYKLRLDVGVEGKSLDAAAKK